MEATVFCFLMLQKYINSKQKTQKTDYALCLGNVWKDFTINNMTKTGLKGVVKLFPVDFNPIDNNDIIDILKIWWKEHNIT